MRIIFLFAVFLSVFVFSLVLVCGMPGIPFCSVVSANSLVLGSGAIHLGLTSAAFFFLWKPDLKAMLKKLGFPGSLKNTIIYSIGGLAAVFTALLILSFIFFMAGLNDQQKVLDKISGLPFYILVFAVVFAPLSEELFFRGLLVPRIGIFGSSLLFGVSHLTYGSIAEIAGVIVVGIILAVIFKRSKSITPCILIHIIYNGVSLAVMKLLT